MLQQAALGDRPARATRGATRVPCGDWTNEKGATRRTHKNGTIGFNRVLIELCKLCAQKAKGDR